MTTLLKPTFRALAACLLLANFAGLALATDPCFAGCQYAYPDGWVGFVPTNNPQCCYYDDQGYLRRGSCAQHQPYLFRCDPFVRIEGDAGPYLVLPGNLEVGKNIDGDWRSYTAYYYTELCLCGFYEGEPNCVCHADDPPSQVFETHSCIDCTR